MIPICVASKFKRLNQSSLISRSCWHKVQHMITSVWLLGVSDVETALETPKPGWQSPMPTTRSDNIQQKYCWRTCWQTGLQRCCAWLQLWKDVTGLQTDSIAAQHEYSVGCFHDNMMVQHAFSGWCELLDRRSGYLQSNLVSGRVRIKWLFYVT